MEVGKLKIEVRNISKIFPKNHIALKDITLTFNKSKVIGLLGENGAGKTTLMDIIASVQYQSEGTVFIDDKKRESSEEVRESRKKIGYMPQEFGMYPTLSVEDNIRYFGYLHGLKHGATEKQVQYLIEALHLWEHRKKKYKALSGGMKRRVGLAVALVHNPEFLIIDEPTAGVDPEERSSIREFIMNLGKTKTILFSTHIIEDIEQISDQIIILKKGRIKFQGELSALLEKFEGHFYEIPFSEKIPKKTRVIKRFKSKLGERIIIYSDEVTTTEIDTSIPVVATLENCFLVLNGEE